KRKNILCDTCHTDLRTSVAVQQIARAGFRDLLGRRKTDSRRQLFVQAAHDLLWRHRVDQLDRRALSLSGYADRERIRERDSLTRVEARAERDRQLRPANRPLERPENIQMPQPPDRFALLEG